MSLFYHFRERPSINTILKKPLLQSRIRKFLSESEIASEFSHTVMHGVKLKKALPPGGARPLPPRPVPVPSKLVIPSDSLSSGEGYAEWIHMFDLHHF